MSVSIIGLIITQPRPFATIRAFGKKRVVLKVIKFEGIDNVRDLGGTPVAGGRAVVPGLLYRGGTLAKASEKDCKLLFEELGVRCVIDMRTGWERNEKPDAEWPGVENLHIPFYDKDIVGIEYTEPAEGTKVVGRDVACVPDHFYRSLANPLTVGMMRIGVNEVFSRIERGIPVFEHCNGGKDRAGILTLLLLTVLGASRETIEEDYLFTNVSRDARYGQMMERFLRFSQGDKEQARALVEAHRARPEYLTAFYESVEEAYGSMDDFVRNQLGISDARREEIRNACTAPERVEAGNRAPALCAV